MTKRMLISAGVGLVLGFGLLIQDMPETQALYLSTGAVVVTALVAAGAAVGARVGAVVAAGAVVTVGGTAVLVGGA